MDIKLGAKIKSPIQIVFIVLFILSIILNFLVSFDTNSLFRLLPLGIVFATIFRPIILKDTFFYLQLTKIDYANVKRIYESTLLGEKVLCFEFNKKIMISKKTAIYKKNFEEHIPIIIQTIKDKNPSVIVEI